MRHCLSQPCEHFAGLPPCPYAEAAWQSGEVSVIVTDRLGRVSTLKKELPPELGQTYVVAWTKPWEMTPQAFDQWIEQQNLAHRGIWAMGFHPQADEAEGIEPLPIEIESEYAVILLQRIEMVVAASEKLMGTGYYRGYSKAELEALHARAKMTQGA